MPSLFREARRVGSVLSYEQASLDQIIPETMPQPGALHDRLMLPGGIGLVLYDGAKDALSFDWMQWGERAEHRVAGPHQSLEPTLQLADLTGGRAFRKLVRRRCVVPLTRYSVPVRDGDIWAHRWITPDHGKVICAAGVWAAERGEQPRFALVTDSAETVPHVEPAGPLLLAESELLLWLRAPIKDVLARLGRREGAPD